MNMLRNDSEEKMSHKRIGKHNIIHNLYIKKYFEYTKNETFLLLLIKWHQLTQYDD